MPKETFFRLPEEKRRRIYQAAVEEFAAYRFSDASINRMVKAAGIPRGSFYQYFKNKEDLYLYVMGEIGKEKLKVLSRYGPADDQAGFFETAKSALPAVFDWAESHPLYNRIGFLMALDDSDFIRMVMKKINDSQPFLRQMLKKDQAKGLIRPEIDTDLVADMYLNLALGLCRDYYGGTPREEIIGKVGSLLEIICHGILA
ncbi:MAG: TetR/AcrR family transcriptional regulator [Peptococcaceae bacterium]|nr:TetR/AcrR family transcriptional regulator [Peptococcaceae bacterium]